MERFQSNIRPTRSGVYVILFGFALFTSSLFTNTNLLLLMDLFLASLLLCNYLYLRQLNLSAVRFLLPQWQEQDKNLVVPLEYPRSDLSFAGQAYLVWEGVDRQFVQNGVILCFSDQHLHCQPFPFRGEFQLMEIRIEVSYPLELFRKTCSITPRHLTLVCPQMMFHDIPILRSALSQDNDPTALGELRPYSSGDEMRRVAWKTFARTGQMYVRSLQDENNSDKPVMNIHYDQETEMIVMQTVAWLIDHYRRNSIPFEFRALEMKVNHFNTDVECMRFLALAKSYGDGK